MNHRILISVVALLIAITSCNMSKKPTTEEAYSGHKIEVKEVLQANAYTYLLGEENNNKYWMAVPKMVAQVGDILYYTEGFEMVDFQSKDLQRVFESVYFIQEISNVPPKPKEAMMNQPHSGKPELVKSSVKIEPIRGGIALEELFGNKDNYNSKKVIVTGKIVKVNYGIMNKNWFHLQDGTEGNGLFDLTITSMVENVKEGDILTFEGTIAVNKDFGHGYKYDIIMEDANLVSK